MKSALTTLLETLTPESSSVLTASVAEAARRSHGHTTPLHVASSFLVHTSTSSLLRDACLRSRPSPHPLRCRALDLCFSVALERLPATSSPSPSPPLSNALLAAVKRAQAHQRQAQAQAQQQPLLAVKVELWQLVVSILDDPSVSRVMREAGFSSPAVKAEIENSLSPHPPSTPINTYVNPRLRQLGNPENNEIGRVSDIYSRPNKRNPSLVGEDEPRTVMKDLQVVPIAPGSTFPRMISSLGRNGILSGSVDSFSPMKTFQNPNATQRRGPERLDPTKASSRCPKCTENYEQELAKLVAKEYEKSSSEVSSEPARPPLPQWLQNAKSDSGSDARRSDQSKTKDQEMEFKQKTEELQKKWSDTCLRLHPNFHNNLGSQRVGPPPMTLYNPKLLRHQPSQQKSQPNKALGINQLNSCPTKLNSPPRSPVRTDLVLGRPKITEPSVENKEKDRVMDLLGCISSEYQVEKFAKALDTDSYKRLLKGLTDKVWWQKEAASKVASAVTNGKIGDGKRRGTQSKGDTWILFTGPDRIGKNKMASVISEQICGSDPIMITLGRTRSDEEKSMNFRGKTVLDRIVEAVRRNPFSVIMLEDIDEADMLIRGSLKRAMERGRLSDSSGREISLGNVIFILTANWLPDNFKKPGSDQILDENNIGNLSSSGFQLRLRVSEKRAKRRGDWLHDRCIKPRRESGLDLSLDLNIMGDFDDDRTDESLNSSDLTSDLDDDQIQRFSITSVPIELANFIDDVVVFKPVETNSVRNEIRNKILEIFSNVVEEILLQIDEEALEKILGGVWLGRTGLIEWGEKVLIPSFQKFKTFLPSTTSSDENSVIRLEIDSDSGIRSTGDWLPSSIRV